MSRVQSILALAKQCACIAENEVLSLSSVFVESLKLDKSSIVDSNVVYFFLNKCIGCMELVTNLTIESALTDEAFNKIADALHALNADRECYKQISVIRHLVLAQKSLTTFRNCLRNRQLQFDLGVFKEQINKVIQQLEGLEKRLIATTHSGDFDALSIVVLAVFRFIYENVFNNQRPRKGVGGASDSDDKHTQKLLDDVESYLSTSIPYFLDIDQFKVVLLQTLIRFICDLDEDECQWGRHMSSSEQSILHRQNSNILLSAGISNSQASQSHQYHTDLTKRTLEETSPDSELCHNLSGVVKKKQRHTKISGPASNSAPMTSNQQGQLKQKQHQLQLHKSQQEQIVQKQQLQQQRKILQGQHQLLQQEKEEMEPKQPQQQQGKLQIQQIRLRRQQQEKVLQLQHKKKEQNPQQQQRYKPHLRQQKKQQLQQHIKKQQKHHESPLESLQSITQNQDSHLPPGNDNGQRISAPSVLNRKDNSKDYRSGAAAKTSTNQHENIKKNDKKEGEVVENIPRGGRRTKFKFQFSPDMTESDKEKEILRVVRSIGSRKTKSGFLFSPDLNEKMFQYARMQRRTHNGSRSLSWQVFMKENPDIFKGAGFSGTEVSDRWKTMRRNGIDEFLD